jgi:hypothetical protein
MIKYGNFLSPADVSESRCRAKTEVESMTRILTFALASSLYLLGSPAIACDYPERPGIPDGATTSKDELLAAKDAVQSFIAAVDDYLTCLENEEKMAVAALDSPSKEELQRRDEMINKKFDAANEEKVLVGEQFNQQIRAYNEKVKADAE